MLSCNMGDLVPILCKEVLPGDKIKVSTELLIKFAPMKAPAMGQVTAYVHYFFVPQYQINDVFQDFINPKVNDGSVVLPFCYPVNIGTYYASPVGSLADYLGLPVTQTNWYFDAGNYKDKILIDPFRAYQHIYNCFYRDQNAEPDGSISLFDVEACRGASGHIGGWLLDAGMDSGTALTALFKLRKRAWGHDYFTSALPSPQAGDDVLIPITSQVTPDGPMKFDTRGAGGDAGPLYDSDASFGPVSGSDVDNFLSDSQGDHAYYKSGLKAINSTATINDLRRAMALQKFKELAERGGGRYSEMVRNFFGAFLKDYWVDRPILLGGQKQRVKIGEVLQTSMSSGTEALGERAGVGGSYGRTAGVSLKAPCHGYLLGILSIRPKAFYYQGVEKMWSRHSLFDWAFPQFANMGEEEIYGREIFADAGASDDDPNKKIFGYTPRYASYKVGHSVIAGEFRTSLDYWHFARKFANSPELNKSFIMMDSVPTRPFNVLDATTEHVYVDLYNTVIARRALPYFGTPKLL